MPFLLFLFLTDLLFVLPWPHFVLRHTGFSSSDTDDDLYPPFSFARRPAHDTTPVPIVTPAASSSPHSARPPTHRGGIRVDDEAQRIARIMHGCDNTRGFVRAGDGYSSDEFGSGSDFGNAAAPSMEL